MRAIYVLCGLGLAFVPTPGQAVDQKQKETCKVTSEIVMMSVTQRVSGNSMDAAKDIFMTGDSAVAEKYQPTVGPLVEWVYSLEAEVIAEAGAPKSISATYKESCLGYKP